MTTRMFSFILLLLVTPLSAETYDSRILQPSPTEDWFTLSTQHFDLHFTLEHKDYTQKLAEIAEIQHEKLSKKLQWTPTLKTQIVVNDSVDFSNGATTIIPYNQFFVYMNEPTDGDLKDQTDFLETLFTHEYTHVLHNDQLDGFPSKIRTLFGKPLSGSGLVSILSMPQIFAPQWVSEGIAVYTESEKGYGRGNSAIYKAKMREEVIKGLASFTAESYEGDSGSRWPFGQVYLYGAYFFEFLQERYGEKTVFAYIRNYNRNVLPWQMSKRARQTTGKNARDLWAEFQQYLTDKFTKDIKEIKARGLTKGKIIYSDKWQNQLLAPGPKDSLFFYHDDQKHTPQIKQLLPDGNIKTLASIKGVTSIHWHPQRGLLITKPEVCNNKQLSSDLYQLDLGTLTLRRMTQCARISRAVWGQEDETAFGVKTSSGKNSLVQINPDGTTTTLSELGLGESIGQPGISTDGQRLVAAVKRKQTGWNLESFNLQTQQWTVLTRDNDIPSLPTYSIDDKQVYFVSDHGGQIEFRRLTIATHTIDTLSNSLGYVRQAAINPNGKTWLSEYTGKGDIIRQLTTLETKGDNYAAMPSHISPIDTLPTSNTFNPAQHNKIKPYRVRDTIRPYGWEPIYQADNKSRGLGLVIAGQDVLGFHSWVLAPTYFDFEDISHYGGFASYSYNDRLTLSASSSLQVTYLEDDAEIPDFHELQDNIQLLAHKPLNRFEWAMDFFAGAAWEKTRNITYSDKTKATTQDVISGLGLSYNNFDRFGHAITADTGIALDLTLESFDLIEKRSDHEGLAAVFQSQGNWRFGDNQTLVATLDLGTGDKDGKPFSLGGNTEGNETLGGITKLGRREFSLRGYTRHQGLSGKNFARASLAWHFPIANIYNGLYIPPLGLGKLHGNIFTETGDAWNEKEDRSLLQSVGIELNTEIKIGYDMFTLPISFGFAHGLDDEKGDNTAYVRLGVGLQ
ncbi:MAG: hypothetical protein DSZ28_07885 [Thiothrix sp.]|nr:MAG: hypothetical protein DSZ28_07885 [Thiothrix sp.]